MTIGKLRDVENANPFVPFKIRMASGAIYNVPHRDYLSIHPDGRIAHVYLPNDSSTRIDVKQIAELVEEPILPRPLEKGA